MKTSQLKSLSYLHLSEQAARFTVNTLSYLRYIKNIEFNMRNYIKKAFIASLNGLPTCLNVIIYIPASILTLFLLTSCEFRNEEKLDFIPCDTTNITYATVRPIFENNCVRCHNEFTNYFDIKLSSYDNVKAAAQSGYLIKAVNHLPDVVPMPFQLPKLGDCEVRKITIWIQNNTPQ